MRVINSIEEFKLLRKDFNYHSIGFVPTMGNLHKGHQSLLETSIKNNKCTILSIYINPAQFDNKNDLNNYPKTLEQDLQIAEKLNVDYVLIPKDKEVYHDNYAFRVTENTELSQKLDGEHRPGHFTAMMTIVMKLLLITKPTTAYFGEKDYQQYLLVKGMAEAFFLDTNIVVLPTIRDKNGLPLSSRNSRLSSGELTKAALFSKLIASSFSDSEIKKKLVESGFVVDYIEQYRGRRFCAVKLGGVRLIDNQPIKTHQIPN